MHLWTIQPVEVAESLVAGHTHVCDPARSELWTEIEDFRQAYTWMCTQLDAHAGTDPSTRPELPIWAWRRWGGEVRRPDRRHSLFRYARKEAIIHCGIPDDQVLLSDFEDWHSVLNGYPHLDESEWLRLGALHQRGLGDDPFDWPLDRTEATWPGVLGDHGGNTQAVFWQLEPTQVLDIHWPRSAPDH